MLDTDHRWISDKVCPTLPSSAIPSVPKVHSYFHHISDTPPFVLVPLVSPFVPMFPVSLISVSMPPNFGNRSVTQAAQKDMSWWEHVATHMFPWKSWIQGCPANSQGKEGDRMHPQRAYDNITCSEAWEGTSLCFATCPIRDTIRYCERVNQHDADLGNEQGSMSSSCQARAWQYIESTRCRFLAVVLKGNTKRHGLCL